MEASYHQRTQIDELDEIEEETEKKEISGKLIYIPVKIQEFQLYQKPNNAKSTVVRVINEATEVTSEETIKASDSEVENDTVRSDKKKEEPIILLSAPEHKPIGSNIILPNTYTHIETITSVQPTGKCASLKQNLSYSECECGPLESQVMGDEINVEANIEERNFTDNSTNQKLNDEQVTVQSYGTLIF